MADMLRKLTEDITRMQRQAEGAPITTFLHYKKMREEYLNIQGLIFLLQERSARIPKQLPDGFRACSQLSQMTVAAR